VALKRAKGLAPNDPILAKLLRELSTSGVSPQPSRKESADSYLKSLKNLLLGEALVSLREKSQEDLLYYPLTSSR